MEKIYATYEQVKEIADTLIIDVEKQSDGRIKVLTGRQGTEYSDIININDLCVGYAMGSGTTLEHAKKTLKVKIATRLLYGAA